MGRHLIPRYGQVILDSRYPILTAVNWSQHWCAICAEYQFSYAPKRARKCEIEHWFPCGADGRAVYGHVITKFSGMGRFTHPLCSAGALRSRSSAIKWFHAIWHNRWPNLTNLTQSQGRGKTTSPACMCAPMRKSGTSCSHTSKIVQDRLAEGVELNIYLRLSGFPSSLLRTCSHSRCSQNTYLVWFSWRHWS